MSTHISISIGKKILCLFFISLPECPQVSLISYNDNDPCPHKLESRTYARPAGSSSTESRLRAKGGPFEVSGCKFDSSQRNLVP